LKISKISKEQKEKTMNKASEKDEMLLVVITYSYISEGEGKNEQKKYLKK